MICNVNKQKNGCELYVYCRKRADLNGGPRHCDTREKNEVNSLSL